MTSEEARTSVLVLRIYPGREIRGAVYLDDGETTRYEAGERAEIRVRGGADSRPGPDAEITLEITREGDESLPLLGAHRGLCVLVAAPQTPTKAVRAVGTAAPAGGENRPGGAVARPLVTAEGCAVDGVGRSGGFVRFGISELRMPARLVLHLSSP